VQFRADLGPPRFVLFMIDPSDAREVVLPLGCDRWMSARQLQPGQTPADFDQPRLVAAIRAATGVGDLGPTIIGVLPFAMTGTVATALRAGPGFLVGDAAHRTTPMGGTGMNTAIHAGHNLGWKLAWAARGWAGAGLLDSYAAERRRSEGRRATRRGPRPDDANRAAALVRPDGHVAALLRRPADLPAALTTLAARPRPDGVAPNRLRGSSHDHRTC
jgi:2-polyprenyl-6-methoxyphenol hydroxylase-like FAD-dependent oxidoreductase